MTSKQVDFFYEKLGDRIRSHRILANLKQEPFALLLGLSRSSVVNIEKGRQRPSVHLLFEICNVFKISLLQLLQPFEDEMTIHDDGVDPKWIRHVEKRVNGDEVSVEMITAFLKNA